MSDYKHNSMNEPREADEECITIFRAVKDEIIAEIRKLNKDDEIHDLHRMDKLKNISEFTPVLYAYEDVAFGRTYFGKIHLGDEKYIHARVHKGVDNKITFYSLWTEPDGAVWDKDTPLKYFID
ncbi:hypothetical protein BG011_000535 [Mortierella polycephala]|uniref:Uncharacterized protein n=1 Tax=Mortierella polycephala TaxID=41804 RepID=A0A9P6U6Q7_9FUNG|nr:hypothetical protein BG011_000535 [Mortierella polycephala]